MFDGYTPKSRVPYYFGPLARRLGKINDLIDCGAIHATTDLETDRVGKSSRPAVQGVEILGDGATYLIADLIDAGLFDVEFEIKSITSGNTEIFIDERLNGGTHFIFWGATKWSTTSGTVSYETINGVDYVSVKDFQMNTSDFTIFSRYTFTDNIISNLLSLKMTNKTTGITYTLDTNGDWNATTPLGVYQLIPSDNSESILSQQYIAPEPATQINTDVISLADDYGYTIADGTQYYDELETQLIPIGTIIPNYPNGVTSSAYVDGVHPSGTYYGRVKYDARIIDGVTDNGVGYSNWSISLGTGTTINDDNIVFEGDGTFMDAILPTKIEDNIEVTLVFNVTSTTIFLSSSVQVNPTSIAGTTLFIDCRAIGEKRTTFVTANPITSNQIRLVLSSNALLGDNVTISDIRLYVGDYATGAPPLPESGAGVDGNSWIIADKYNGIISTDDTEILYTSGEEKLLRFSDQPNITEDKFFFDSTTNKTLFFEEPLTEPCYTKAVRYMGFLGDQLQDIDEILLFDEDGNPLYSLKDGVTSV